MSVILKFIGGLVATAAITVTGAAVAIGAYAAATKPEDKTLQKDIEQKMTEKSGNPVEHIVDKVAAKFTTATSTSNVKDYVFFKTADVTFADGSSQKFVGAFQNWVPADNIRL